MTVPAVRVEVEGEAVIAYTRPRELPRAERPLGPLRADRQTIRSRLLVCPRSALGCSHRPWHLRRFGLYLAAAMRPAFTFPVHDLDVAGRTVQATIPRSFFDEALTGCEVQPAGPDGALDV